MDAGQARIAGPRGARTRRALREPTRAAIATIAVVGLGLVLGAVPASASDGTFLTKWGTQGSGDGQFDSPCGVATDAATGDVYVADANDRIQKFDSGGGFLTKWGSVGSGEGQFDGPCGVATDAAGDVYVVDGANHRIQKFDSGGGFIRMWGWGVDDGTNAFQTCTSGCQAGISGSGDGQFDGPFGVATDPAGDVYVSEPFINDRIQKFDSDGTFLTKWGSRGDGDGQFVFPLGVATDAAGDVYVADGNNHRIQKFDSDGGFIRTWGWGVDDGTNAFQTCTSGCESGFSGSGDGQLDQAIAVATDAAGDVYVADTVNNRRIQKFDSDGGFILMWGWGVDDGTNALQTCTSGCESGISGSGDGQFDFAEGVAADAVGDVYVADTNNHRIQKFGTDRGCTITGTSAGERLKGTNGDDVICGLGGIDRINGRGGDDVLYGDAGNDQLIGAAGSDDLDGGFGNTDTANYNPATEGVEVDLGTGGVANDGQGSAETVANVERVRGARNQLNDLTGDGDDNRLIGGELADLLFGAGGADLMRGGGDDDVLVGGDGADALFPGLGSNTIVGASGSDTLFYTGLGVAAGVEVDNLDGGGSTTGAVSDLFAGIENVAGTPNADDITVGWAGVANVIKGRDGDDTLSTVDTDALDTMHGGAGADTCNNADLETAINC